MVQTSSSLANLSPKLTVGPNLPCQLMQGYEEQQGKLLGQKHHENSQFMHTKPKQKKNKREEGALLKETKPCNSSKDKEKQWPRPRGDGWKGSG